MPAALTRFPMAPALPRPQAVLFDFGNTLLREDRCEPSAGIRSLLRLATRPLAGDPEKAEQVAAELYAEVRAQRGSGLVEFPCRSFVRLLGDLLRIAWDQSPAALELEFWKALGSMVPEEGIDAVLAWLKGRNIAMGVVSNAMFSADVLSWELARHGLAEAFQFVMSSADYGFQKPHPALFMTGVATLGLQPKEVWFVGDNIEKDVAGALQAGLAAVWYNPQNAPCTGEPPPLQVGDWAAFLALLRAVP
jgi:HAD superfamily hydrolase (TIGR01509 family)